ncbi:hypothetical protein Dimus_034395 [Dionaea muscipula]
MNISSREEPIPPSAHHAPLAKPSAASAAAMDATAAVKIRSAMDATAAIDLPSSPTTTSHHHPHTDDDGLMVLKGYCAQPSIVVECDGDGGDVRWSSVMEMAASGSVAAMEMAASVVTSDGHGGRVR